MATFASPGVNTFVEYGYDLPTTRSISFATDFNGYLPPTDATVANMRSGDGIVEIMCAEAIWRLGSAFCPPDRFVFLMR
jgi:hypothetical protein